MSKLVLVFGLVLVLILGASMYSASYGQEYKMQKLIDQATAIINEFKEIPEDTIPTSVLNNCKGLAVISVLKGGFIIGARGGSGIVVAKDASGAWTAPSAIGMGGASIGFQIGAQQTDFVLVLNTQSAVDAFKQSNMTLGPDAAVSAGPVGRNAEVDLTVASAVFSYSRSRGLFAGVSLEGAIITEENGVNEQFYGHPHTAQQILSGTVPPPASASALYSALSPYGTVRAETVTTTETTTE